MFDVPPQSPEELQRERQVPRIGLDTGNLAERATGLLHQVDRAVRGGWQAKCCIGKRQVLMVKSIEDFPPEFEVPGLREVEIFHQRRIKVPKTGTTNGVRPRLHISERPRPRIEDSVVRPEVRIIAKSGLKGSRINPIRYSLGFGAMPAETRIADHVAPASRLLVSGTRGAELLEFAGGTGNGQWQALLGIEVAT